VARGRKVKHTEHGEVIRSNAGGLVGWKIWYRPAGGRGPQRTHTFRARTLEDAKDAAATFLARQRTSRARGRDHSRVDDGRILLRDYWTQTIAACEEIGHPAASTLYGWKCTWRTHVEPTLGAIQLAEIRKTHVKAMVTRIQRRSRYAAENALSITKWILSRAVEEDILEVNHALSVVRPARVLVKPRRIAEPEQLDRAASHLSDWYRTLPYVAAYGGLRVSEACGITLEGIDWLRREIRLEFGLVETTKLNVSDLKTDAAKATIVMPEFVMNMLAEHVRKYPPPPITLELPDGRKIDRHLVFTTLRNKPIRSKRFRAKYWKPALEKAGLPADLQLMHLRHTGGTYVHRATGDLKAVADFLRHTTTRMADQIYVQDADGRRREVARRLEALEPGRRTPSDVAGLLVDEKAAH